MEERKKAKYRKVCILVFVCILAAGVFGSIFMLSAPHGTKVNIVQDGTVLYQLDLSETENQTMDITYEGRVNTVQIEDGKIRVLKADCPDNTCVHMGWLESGALPIVCLPNHLSIEFVKKDDALDAVIR